MGVKSLFFVFFCYFPCHDRSSEGRPPPPLCPPVAPAVVEGCQMVVACRCTGQAGPTERGSGGERARPYEA